MDRVSARAEVTEGAVRSATAFCRAPNRSRACRSRSSSPLGCCTDGAARTVGRVRTVITGTHRTGTRGRALFHPPIRVIVAARATPVHT